MRFFFAWVVVLVTGCAPLVQVVRVEKPLMTLAPEQQPVRVMREWPDALFFTVLDLFADHSGDYLAIERLKVALAEAGVPVADGEGPGLTLRVQLQRLSLEGQGESRKARADLSIAGPLPQKTTSATVTVMKGEADEALAGRAIDEAAKSFADGFRAHEVSDSFWLSKRDDLQEGNAHFLDGRPEEALKHYQYVLDAKPDDLAAMENIVAVLTAMGRLEEAAAAAHRLAAATTGALRINREQQAAEADRRAARTERVERFSVAK